jgi:hypothetical protein
MQIPNNIQIPITNNQTKMFKYWNLIIGYCLVIVSWDLIISSLLVIVWLLYLGI